MRRLKETEKTKENRLNNKSDRVVYRRLEETEEQITYMVGSVHTTKTFLLVWTDPSICYTYPPHDAYIWSRRAKTAYCTKQNRDGTRKRKWAKEAKRDVGDKNFTLY
jgi:hypothetical protein